MARPYKEGLEYFPFDTQFFNDPKIRLMTMKYGAKGTTTILSLYCLIYFGNGYYINLDDNIVDVIVLNINDVNVDNNLVNVVINEAINRKLFSKDMFDKYGILTSVRIQKTYLKATERRKNLRMVRDYTFPETLIYAEENKIKLSLSYPQDNADDNRVNVNINYDIVDNNSINVSNSTQSKVNKSKVNKSKDIINNNNNITEHGKNSHNPLKLWEQEIGSLSGTIAEILNYYLEQGLSGEVVCDAIKRGVKADARNLNYIETILKGWADKKIFTMADVEKEDQKHSKNKKVQMRRMPTAEEKNDSIDLDMELLYGIKPQDNK